MTYPMHMQPVLIFYCLAPAGGTYWWLWQCLSRGPDFRQCMHRHPHTIIITVMQAQRTTFYSIL